jgi:hypothetical protein
MQNTTKISPTNFRIFRVTSVLDGGVRFPSCIIMWHDDKIMSDQSLNKYKYILCIYSSWETKVK